MSGEAPAHVLTLDIERTGDTAVVRCRGRLVAGVNDVLYTEVSRLIPDTKRIILDLTDLNQMDSMGLGGLIRLYASVRKAGGELVLINLGPRIRQLLGMTHLLSAFTVVGENNITIP
jgi:anti-sigma B factor antagonist